MHKCLFIADTNEPCVYDTTKEYCDYFGESRNNEHKKCPFYGGKVICSTAPYPECNGANGCDTCEHQEEE